MDEGLAEQTLKDLETSKEPAKTLVYFYIKLYDLHFTKELITTFYRLMKVYSKQQIFYAILDTLDVPTFRPEQPYGMLSFFLKKRLEKKNISPQAVIDTSKLDIKIKQNQQNQIKIDDPFQENKNENHITQ